MLNLRKTRIQLLHLGLVSRAMSAATQSSIPIANIPGLGKLEGVTKQTPWTNKSFYGFLGVKYAETPVGERRFKPPVPVQPWDGIKQAKTFGASAPTPRTVFKLKPEQLSPELEDCLNLNVYTKDLTAKKPVMVFIHGGNFIEGSAYQHPGDYFMEKEVVLVVPQYRLGPLGFLSLQSDDIPGNAGIFDVKLALEWVQQNIEAFGGDPDNVTIFGQSAGGSIISTMLISPNMPDNLFHKVIISSCAALGAWVWDEEPEEHGRNIAKMAGLNPLAPRKELEEAFAKMDLITLFKSFMKHNMKGMLKGCDKCGGNRINVGGPSGFLPEPPLELIRKGAIKKGIPMLTGVVRDDGAIGLLDSYSRGANQEKFNSVMMLDKLLLLLGIRDRSGSYLTHVMKEYFTQEELERGLFKEMGQGILDLYGTSCLKAPILRMAQLNSMYDPENTWLYTLDYKGEFTRFGYGMQLPKLPFEVGVCHDDDNIYLFPWPKPFANLNEEDTKISQTMIELWTNFAINGKPSATGVPEWPSVSTSVGPYLHINKECTVGDNFMDEFTAASRERHAKLAAEKK